MNKRIKIGMLTIAVATAGFISRAATYNGDLVIGFSDGVGNDLVYDLGSSSALVDGQQWSLATRLSSFNLAGVNWGVIGSATVSGVRTAWITTSGAEPLLVPNTSAWGKINTAISTLYTGLPAAGAGQYGYLLPADASSWNQQTINGSLATQYYNVYQNPNQVGTTCANFYRVAAPNVTPALLGTLCLANDGTLTFHTVSVVKPAPTLTIARNESVNTISFQGLAGAIYTLYGTNTDGLTAPTANWSVLGTTNGSNAVLSFTDNTTVSNRVYRVRVQ